MLRRSFFNAMYEHLEVKGSAVRQAGKVYAPVGMPLETCVVKIAKDNHADLQPDIKAEIISTIMLNLSKSKNEEHKAKCQSFLDKETDDLTSVFKSIDTNIAALLHGELQHASDENIKKLVQALEPLKTQQLYSMSEGVVQEKFETMEEDEKEPVAAGASAQSMTSAKKGKIPGNYMVPQPNRYDIHKIEGMQMIRIHGESVWYHESKDVVAKNLVPKLSTELQTAMQEEEKAKKAGIPPPDYRDWSKHIPGWDKLKTEQERMKAITAARENVDREVAQYVTKCSIESTVVVRPEQTTVWNVMKDSAADKFENCRTSQRMTMPFNPASAFQNNATFSFQETDDDGNMRVDRKGGNNTTHAMWLWAAEKEHTLYINGKKLPITIQHKAQILNAVCKKETLSEERDGEVQAYVADQKKARAHEEFASLSNLPVVNYVAKTGANNIGFMSRPVQDLCSAQLVYAAKHGQEGVPSLILMEALEGPDKWHKDGLWTNEQTYGYATMTYFCIEGMHKKFPELLKKVEHGMHQAYGIVAAIMAQSPGMKYSKYTDQEVNEMLEKRYNQESAMHGFIIGGKMIKVIRDHSSVLTTIRMTPFLVMMFQRSWGYVDMELETVRKMLTVVDVTKALDLDKTEYHKTMREAFEHIYEGEEARPALKFCLLKLDFARLLGDKFDCWSEKKAEALDDYVKQTAAEMKLCVNGELYEQIHKSSTTLKRKEQA